MCAAPLRYVEYSAAGFGGAKILSEDYDHRNSYRYSNRHHDYHDYLYHLLQVIIAIAIATTTVLMVAVSSRSCFLSPPPARSSTSLTPS